MSDNGNGTGDKRDLFETYESKRLPPVLSGGLCGGQKRN